MENTIHSKELNQLMIAPIVLQVLIAWVPILQRPLVFVRVDIIAHLEVSQKLKKLLKQGIMLLQDLQYRYRVNQGHMQLMLLKKNVLDVKKVNTVPILV